MPKGNSSVNYMNKHKLIYYFASIVMALLGGWFGNSGVQYFLNGYVSSALGFLCCSSAFFYVSFNPKILTLTFPPKIEDFRQESSVASIFSIITLILLVVLLLGKISIFMLYILNG